MGHLRCCIKYFREKFQVTALFTTSFECHNQSERWGKNEVCKRKRNTDRERMEDDNEWEKEIRNGK